VKEMETREEREWLEAVKKFQYSECDFCGNPNCKSTKVINNPERVLFCEVKGLQLKF
jgi:hypothetical protein